MGLGATTYNTSTLMKMVLRSLEIEDVFSMKMMRSIYYPTETSLHEQRGSRTSRAWTNLLEGRDILTQH